jgi:hypothetical protein
LIYILQTVPNVIYSLTAVVVVVGGGVVAVAAGIKMCG